MPKSTKLLKVYILGVSVCLFVRLRNSDFGGIIKKIFKIFFRLCHADKNLS